MARRRLLNDEVWARHLGWPTDEREIARHCTLGADELALVALRRGDTNRLGFALVLLCLRMPGPVLEAGEVPPEDVLAHVARQVDVPPEAFGDYARRDPTEAAPMSPRPCGSGTSRPSTAPRPVPPSPFSPLPPRRSSAPASLPASWSMSCAVGGWRRRPHSCSKP